MQQTDLWRYSPFYSNIMPYQLQTQKHQAVNYQQHHNILQNRDKIIDHLGFLLGSHQQEVVLHRLGKISSRQAY